MYNQESRVHGNKLLFLSVLEKSFERVLKGRQLSSSNHGVIIINSSVGPAEMCGSKDERYCTQRMTEQQVRAEP